MVIGVSLLVMTETMFFAGLISAFLVARAHTDSWPPVGQPRLPVATTAFNTMLLLFSAQTMWWAIRESRKEWLTKTAFLGAAFVALQGGEWVRLVGYGLTVRSGIYGAFFYTLVGMHGLHVLMGLAALACAHRYFSDVVTRSTAIYWWFVVALWPLLYLLVYVL